MENPKAKKIPHKLINHNTERIDNYHWMRLSDKQKESKKKDNKVSEKKLEKEKSSTKDIKAKNKKEPNSKKTNLDSKPKQSKK